jgi:transcriptional regulator with XRE-family HTH domain
MNYPSFDKKLRMLIASRGLTVNAFSVDIGIPTATMSRYLSGGREPKFSYVVKIAEYFNVSIDWLMGLNGDKFDVLPEDIQDVASLYSIASEDDRRVVRAVLSKYKQKE